MTLGRQGRVKGGGGGGKVGGGDWAVGGEGVGRRWEEGSSHGDRLQEILKRFKYNAYSYKSKNTISV